MHLAILKNDTLRSINLYSIPTYLLERIDTTKNIKIETRVEVFYKKVTQIVLRTLDTESDISFQTKAELCQSLL